MTGGVEESVYPLLTANPYMYTGTLSNSEDPNKMSHYATFHQGLHYLVKQERILENAFLEVTGFDPSVFTMDHPDFVLFSFMENYNDPNNG